MSKLWTHDVFVARTDAYSKRAAKLHLDVWAIAQQCVYKAYASADAGHAWLEYALNKLPESDRRALARYVNRAGITVIPPAEGSKLYAVNKNCVRDRAYQAKAHEFVRTTPVYEVEQKEGRKQNVRVLTGLAVDRAKAAVLATIKRLAKDDPEGSRALNDMFADKLQTSVLFDSKGQKIPLDAEEVALCLKALIQYHEETGGVTLPELKKAA